MLQNLIDLLFTNTCPACSRVLLNNEGFLCTGCMYRLPRTRYRDMRNNPVARLFWGRVNLQYATAIYHYSNGGMLQEIIHKLKYRGNKHAGTELGKLVGMELKGTCYSNVDIVIPVPLHNVKLRQRGYNQSELIAEGLCRELEKPLNRTSCKRLKQTGTQTHKSRYERWENVQGGFNIMERYAFTGKHILLVDDVVTTGATLEALALELLSIGHVQVSVAAVAVADLLA